MKTVTKAILDEIYYPIPIGSVENKLIARGLNGDLEVTKQIMESNDFKGALADCLYSLIQAVNVQEADKSVSALTDKQREAILVRVNNLYSEIGEKEVSLVAKPKVKFL